MKGMKHTSVICPGIKYGSTIAGEVGIIAEHTHVKKAIQIFGEVQWNNMVCDCAKLTKSNKK